MDFTRGCDVERRRDRNVYWLSENYFLDFSLYIVEEHMKFLSRNFMNYFKTSFAINRKGIQGSLKKLKFPHIFHLPISSKYIHTLYNEFLIHVNNKIIGTQ